MGWIKACWIGVGEVVDKYGKIEMREVILEFSRIKDIDPHGRAKFFDVFTRDGIVGSTRTIIVRIRGRYHVHLQ